MFNRVPISVKVFIAPAVVTALMVAVALVANIALTRQQEAFFRVVGGSLTTSTATTKLLLSVAELQSEVLRYAQLQQRLPPEDRVLTNLRGSVRERVAAAERVFDSVRNASGPTESD